MKKKKKTIAILLVNAGDGAENACYGFKGAEVTIHSIISFEAAIGKIEDFGTLIDLIVIRSIGRTCELVEAAKARNPKICIIGIEDDPPTREVLILEGCDHLAYWRESAEVVLKQLRLLAKN